MEVAQRPEGWFCNGCYDPWVFDPVTRGWVFRATAWIPPPDFFTPAGIKARRMPWTPASV